ncbi:LbtU family siderophore porin [Pontiellaceae bacterium B12219]|nr:LbtU family siderophore porin [Pontiellaceae bacterium B12219]
MKNLKGKVLIAGIAALCGNGYAQSAESFEKWGAMTQKGLETFEWGVLLEAEGYYAQTGDEAESDITLATVEFVADTAVTEWLSAHVGLLWEEDDTDPFSMDEGFISIGLDYYTQLGKYYLPFGNFETAFISDPLTLELGEINRSSALIGYRNNKYFDVSAGVFQGYDEDVIQCGYGAVNAFVGETAVIGAYLLSDILETDGFADLKESSESGAPGAGVFANVFLGPVMLNAEFITAISDVTYFGIDYQPMAYNIEGSVNFAEKWLAGLKLEGSGDFMNEVIDPTGTSGIDNLGYFHETGVGGVVSYGFHTNAKVGLEYMRLINKDADDTDLITVQIALEI